MSRDKIFADAPMPTGIRTMPSHHVRIWMAGDLDKARDVCRRYCMEVGLCVTVTPTEFIYTGGAETGFVVGLLNYPRFPAEPEVLRDKAQALAERLRAELCQWSYLLEGSEQTMWVSYRPSQA